MFSELCGFKAGELSSLPTSIQYRLEIKNLLIVGSLLLCGYSAFYLFQLTSLNITTAIIVMLFTLLILFCLQNLIISASGMGCEKINSVNNPNWQPAKIRIYIFLIIALIFSQPLLIALYSQVYESEINQSIDEQKNLHKEFLENSLKEEDEKLTAQLNNQHEILERLTEIKTPNATSLTTTYTTSIKINSSRRKALLIGNQSYPSTPLVNPDKDARDMTNALKEIGFSTILIIDGTKSSMEIAINQYIDSIQPGDISYFYYSGHGMQLHGQNYIIPIDSPYKNPIGINFIIEAISKKNPSANVITIDACRVFAKGDSMGLASLEAGSSGTYISLAAKPGQTASDGMPNTNGVFTGAILKYIKEPIDIDAISRKVITEVTKATANKQEPWINHNLKDPLILSAPQYNPNTPNTPDFQNQLVQTHNTQLPICEQAASQLPPNIVKDFLINCNEKKLFQLEDQIAIHKIAAKKAIEQLNDDMLYTNPIAYTLNSDLYYLKKHPAFLILNTLTITSLLLLGFLMREIDCKEMSAYEKLLSYYLRNVVSEKHREAKRITSLFPHAPHEELRNSASSAYQYRDLEELKTEDSVYTADFFTHLNNKIIGETI